ncbi:MAG: glycosyltransferase family 2 protein [Minisyncoccia bacterium]
MKFTIITPTYKHADKLKRAVESVLHQTYTNWELIIINDSPSDKTYKSFAYTINDPRIRYLINDTNRGVNYSRNRAMDNISPESKWIIFLDDDDYFAQDALETFRKLSIAHPLGKWFVTNRAYADGTLVTKYPKPETWYSYIKDVLILKRCKGDVTHCIKTSLLANIRYSKYIKQAEEWIFYYQISLKEKFYYNDHNSTITDGYDTINGLNFRKRTRSEQLKTLFIFIYEGFKLNLIYHPTFLVYLLMRFVRLIIKG